MPLLVYIDGTGSGAVAWRKTSKWTSLAEVKGAVKGFAVRVSNGQVLEINILQLQNFGGRFRWLRVSGTSWMIKFLGAGYDCPSQARTNTEKEIKLRVAFCAGFVFRHMSRLGCELL